MTTTAKVTHSPLPWRIDDDGGDTHVRDADGASMACDMCYYPWTFKASDTKFLVRAVNSHADMLEALEAALAVIEGGLDMMDKEPPRIAKVVAEARAAIAKAKGAE